MEIHLFQQENTRNTSTNGQISIAMLVYGSVRANVACKACQHTSTCINEAPPLLQRAAAGQLEMWELCPDGWVSSHYPSGGK